MIVAVDTSVIVPAHALWDGRHEAAVGAINRLANEKALIVPWHALMESYSVLTRLPRPFRASPAEAFRALRITFTDVPVASLSSRDVWPLLETFANRGIYGGRIYDTAIARASRDAGADAILTFNVRDFEDLVEGLQVLSP